MATPRVQSEFPRRRLRKADARRFRRVARDRGHSLYRLATERFGVSERQLHRVLKGEVSAPLVEKITRYMQEEA